MTQDPKHAGPTPPQPKHTLKENLLWVQRFETIEELRLALHAFKDTYNRTWIVERHGYRTPAQVRVDQFGLAEAA